MPIQYASIIISCFFGTVIGLIHGLSLIHGSRKAFSLSSHNARNAANESSSKTAVLMGALLPLGRLIMLCVCLYYASQSTTIHIPVALGCFFIASWVTIIRNTYKN